MTVIANTPHLDALASDAGHRKRQTEYAMRCALLCRQYVPREEDALRDSEPLNSRYEDGLLTWNTPYAAKQYYVPMNHTTAGTRDHWDEECARNHKSELMDYARQLILEG